MKSNPDNIKLWVEALRSGRFKQGRKALNNHEQFCCLGVACEVAIENGVPVKKTSLLGRVSYDNNATDLPSSVWKWLGVYAPNPTLGDKTAVFLNDKDLLSFDQIADAIEKTYAV